MSTPETPAQSKDYKNTVFLPQTAFPMKAGLPLSEPKWLELWNTLGIYARLREQSRGKPKFVLHDGPPYANGNIHLGHAVNKVLKDAVVRTYQMMGFDAPYVPGWDCHGLPIEWKIEEKYRAKGQNDKDQVPILDFRAECRAFAAHWVDVQKGDFKRLGIQGDWDKPYTTMTTDAEASIVAEIHKYVMNGGLYRGVRPIMWSTVEKTALAEAEVEYHDHTSTTAYVAFPVVKASMFDIKDAHIVIWTTTPWTLPANRAIAYGDDIDYVVVNTNGKKYVVAQALLTSFYKAVKFEGEIVSALKGSQLAGTICAHPLRGQKYEFDVPLLAGDFVTTETGTGFVHIAPSHGADDFALGRQHNLPIPEMVTDDGKYVDDVPLFAGAPIYYDNGKPGPANKLVLEAIGQTGLLLAEEKLVHSYPHSWRSKAPVIFRATPQWFISMETNDLRKKALAALDDTRFVPETARNRLTAMVESRPDWCISRQRAWGVPIAIFVDKKTNEMLRDESVCERIRDIFKAEGSDSWWQRPAQDFLGSSHNPDDYEQVFDIVDVWFEAGSTHAFVCEERDELTWPVDLYLEGSDQHRGWFQSSLLESCGTRGRAPFNAILSHGFTLDEKGHKMSKSLGNVVEPEKVIKEYGADILRLWVMITDYTQDVRLGPEVLKQTAELYRRLRNTLRYILGGLDGFSEAERLPYAQMPELEKYVLHTLHGLDADMRQRIEAYDFTGVINSIHHFCTTTLSAFYFDIRKDALYCDAVDSIRRRACRTVMDTLFDCLTTWLAPYICFTAEEAWQVRGNTATAASVHLRTFPALPAEWSNPKVANNWTMIRAFREGITKNLEELREQKVIGSSLQAIVKLNGNEKEYLEKWGATPTILKEAFIVSEVHITEELPEGLGFEISKASHLRCERCWQVLPEVGTHSDHTGLCTRCHGVVTGSAPATKNGAAA